MACACKHAKRTLSNLHVKLFFVGDERMEHFIVPVRVRVDHPALGPSVVFVVFQQFHHPAVCSDNVETMGPMWAAERFRVKSPFLGSD